MEAHVLVAFVAYCLLATLKNRLQALAPGLTARAVLETLAAGQMLEVVFPTTDGRRLVMPQYTRPDPEQELLLYQLHLSLADQPPPQSQPSRKYLLSACCIRPDVFAVTALKTKSLFHANLVNAKVRLKMRPQLLTAE